MNLALWLERGAKSYPERGAVAVGDRVVLTYMQLADRVARIAGALRGTVLPRMTAIGVAIVTKNSQLDFSKRCTASGMRVW